MLLDVQFCCLLLLFASRNEHGFVGPVDFEGDCHLFLGFVFEVVLVKQGLVLGVCVFLVDKMVEDLAGILHIEGLPVFQLYLYVLRESLRQQHPDTISI